MKFDGFDAAVEEIKARRPEMEEEPIEQAWGSTELKLCDPFGNKMVFFLQSQ